MPQQQKKTHTHTIYTTSLGIAERRKRFWWLVDIKLISAANLHQVQQNAGRLVCKYIHIQVHIILIEKCVCVCVCHWNELHGHWDRSTISRVSVWVFFALYTFLRATKKHADTIYINSHYNTLTISKSTHTYTYDLAQTCEYEPSADTIYIYIYMWHF